MKRLFITFVVLFAVCVGASAQQTYALITDFEFS